jgi:hypothetical protein
MKQSAKRKPSSISEDASISEINKFLERNKANIFNLSPDTKIRVLQKEKEPNESTRVDVSYFDEIPVDVANLENKVFVSAPFTAKLYFDRDGRFKMHQVKEPDTHTRDILKQELESKMEAGEVSIIQSSDQASPKELAAKRTPFYIQKDSQGRHHLKRGYFSTR